MKRWQELKPQATRKVPTNYAEALRVAADEADAGLLVRQSMLSYG